MVPNDKGKAILAAIVLVVSLAILYSTFFGFGPRVDTAVHKSLGAVIAAEVLKQRGASGKIFVISRDTESQPNPYAEATYEAFAKAIKNGGAVIATNRTLRLNPIRTINVSAAEFVQLFKKATDQDVIVSLAGPAAFADAQVKSLPEKRAKAVAVCIGWIPRQVDLRRAFEQGVLTLAVVSRNESSKLPGNSEQETFNKHFSFITSANLAELPLMASSWIER